jgi:hypothetical protein
MFAFTQTLFIFFTLNGLVMGENLVNLSLSPNLLKYSPLNVHMVHEHILGLTNPKIK